MVLTFTLLPVYLQHNWGYFPSVSAGWTFTEEDFMKERTGANHAPTFGKLRLSWGKNGSISNLGGYMYAATLNSGPSILSGYPIPIAQNAYRMNGSLHVGTYPSQYLANPRLRWEESTQFDAGIDLRFFNGRLNFAFDYYNKITDGLLVQSVSPLTTGTNYMYRNLGEVNNHGFEIEAEWKDHIGDFSYGLKANLSLVYPWLQDRPYRRGDGRGCLSVPRRRSGRHRRRPHEPRQGHSGLYLRIEPEPRL